ncbi:MAG: hypothetical protein GX021_09760 [Tissierellia bacterium]|nr:hypothetical protein [Tissierellia bacterium]
MAQTTIILSIVAVILIVINGKLNGRQYEGIKLGLNQFIRTIPIILGAFILAGIIEVMIPRDFVQNWLSKEAGLKGIVLGSFGGMLLAMGPYAFFPIVSTLMVSGAGLGTLISIITGWSLLSLSKAPFEIGFFGVEFTIKKTIYSIPLSLIAGFIAYIIELLVFT